MPTETAVTPPPIGASRTVDWYINPNGIGLAEAKPRHAMIQQFNPTGSSSNSDANGAGMVLTGAYNYAPVLVGAKWLRMVKMQGTYWFGSTGIPLVTTRPSLKDIGYPLGRYIWEGIFYWSAAAPAIVDSGLLISDAQNARILGNSANFGIGLGSINGVLSFYSRGPGGFESVNVSALAGPLNSLNKLTLVIRQPGFNRDASVTALVNDKVAAVRAWTVAAHKLPVLTSANTRFYPQLTHTLNTVDMWADQIRLSAGPDVPEL